MRKFLVLLFLIPAVCYSETSLWTISKNGNKLYLGGTIHVLKKEDYPLPEEYNKAFKKADKLILEANIEKAQTLEFGKKMTQVLSYPDGKSLKGSIKADTYNKLKKYLADRNIPIESFHKFKPQMIVLIMTVMELKKIGMVNVGVDEFFYNKARQSGMALGFFESVDEQIEFIRTMGQGNEDSMLLSTIKDMNRMQGMMTNMKTAWLHGHEKKLADLGLKDMMHDHPETYQSLLVKRNNNWMPHIEQMINNNKIEIVLVGALHLVGKDGLLQQLRNKGYTVKKYK